MINVFTSAAANYLPKVRALCDSIRLHHPNWKINFVASDKKTNFPNLDNEPFDKVIFIEDLGITNFSQWVFFSNIVELSTAIKPFALKYLLDEKGCEGVVYLDPDIVLFSPLNDIEELLSTNNIVITPHITEPEIATDAILDNELGSLKHGIFNLGFIAVKNSTTGNDFAKWWSDRLYLYCDSDWRKGLFTDQRWIDFVPVFFEKVFILKSKRYNVAPWNLSQRKVTGEISNPHVNGERIAFYHFTGFDSGAHELMVNKYAPENSTLFSLIEWYKKIINSGNNSLRWGYGYFDNDIKISDLARHIYKQRTDLQNHFLNPYSTDKSDTFFNWIKNEGIKEYPELINQQDIN